MGYTPGFEGPHPSTLPTSGGWVQNDLCGHSGYQDRWHGDELTGPGRVWSCGVRCGASGSQIFYPDQEQNIDG